MSRVQIAASAEIIHMVIGLLQMDLRIPENQSLKGKRQVLLSLKTRLRQKFNISISETENQDKWQLATLSAACVGTDQAGVNEMLNHVVDMAGREREIELISMRMEFL